jgi:hypothetical protein
LHSFFDSKRMFDGNFVQVGKDVKRVSDVENEMKRNETK